MVGLTGVFGPAMEGADERDEYGDVAEAPQECIWVSFQSAEMHGSGLYPKRGVGGAAIVQIVEDAGVGGIDILSEFRAFALISCLDGWSPTSPGE